jgi:hypothetical protein
VSHQHVSHQHVSHDEIVICHIWLSFRS